MPRNYTFILWIAILVCVFLPGHSQIQTDAGMWNTISVEKEITKKFSLILDEEIRLRDNFSQLNLLYTNFGVSYKIIKGLKVAIIYRLIEKYEGTNYTFSFRNRLMLDISYRYKIQDFSVSYRSRLQYEVRDYYSSDKGKLPEKFWRNKFEAKYNIKKFTPYVGVELRYQIADPRNQISDEGWHRIRYFWGVDYDINKNNSIGVYYLIQREYYVVNPMDMYIIGLQYSLTLPHE
jgi:hypothetical protein